MKKDIKKIYSCQHQKDAPNSCTICQKGREKQQLTGSSRNVFRCDKCGELIEEGSWYSNEDGNEKYNETWKQDHSDCQSNPEKVKQNKLLKEEIERRRIEIEERKRKLESGEKLEPSDECSHCGKLYNYDISVDKDGKYLFSKKFIEDKKTGKYFCSPECLNKEDKKCKKCGKLIPFGEYYRSRFEINGKQQSEDFFSSIECLRSDDNIAIENEQKSLDTNQTNNSQPEKNTKGSKDNKNWIIFGVIFLATILFLGLIAYIWKRKKR